MGLSELISVFMGMWALIMGVTVAKRSQEKESVRRFYYHTNCGVCGVIVKAVKKCVFDLDEACSHRRQRCVLGNSGQLSPVSYIMTNTGRSLGD